MQVTLTRPFQRMLRNLSSSNAEDVVAALELFVADYQAKPLNFERVRSRKGYFTIRANFSTRILLRQTGTLAYDVVAVGNHDYIYESCFR